MKKIIISIFGFFILFSSCVSQFRFQRRDNEPKYWIIPELNKEAVSYIGDPLLKEGSSFVTEAIVLNKDYEKILYPNGVYKFVGIGNKLLTRDGENISIKMNVYECNSFQGLAEYPILLEDDDGNVYYSSTSTERPLPKDAYTKKIIVDVNDYYFEQQLIYTGMEGKILKFTYREFADGTARPSFTIDPTYDMTQDNIIRFKGAVIEVLSYNNQSIKYKVLSGFKTNWLYIKTR